MQIAEAQREMRAEYLGAGPGQLVSGTVWLVSAALSTWVSHTAGVVALIFGGMLIFPLTWLVLRVVRGRPMVVSRDNPLNALAMQVAFTVPLAIPLILAATAGHAAWFYPGCLIVVGAHYLPFMTLYGLRRFALGAGVLVGGGWLLPNVAPNAFVFGGWLGAAVLLVLGIWLSALPLREAARA